MHCHSKDDLIKGATPAVHRELYFSVTQMFASCSSLVYNARELTLFGDPKYTNHPLLDEYCVFNFLYRGGNQVLLDSFNDPVLCFLVHRNGPYSHPQL